jgi:tetratricopeptide (TPR) repeat protein
MTALLRALIVAVAVSVSAGTVAAQGDEAKAEARALHDRGLEHYAAGRYTEAIDSYRRAYERVPAPGILFNLAQAHRLAGHCDRALELYEQYVRERPQAANAPVAREHAAAMRRCLEKRRPAAEPDTEPDTEPAPESKPMIDGVPAAPTEPAGGLGTDLGTGGPIDRDRGADPGRTKRLAGIGVAAAGALALGTGVYFGLEARSASAEIDGVFRAGGTWSDDLRRTEERGKRANTLMIGFTAAGTAALATGALLYYLGHRDAGDPALALQPTPGGALLSVGWGYDLYP